MQEERGRAQEVPEQRLHRQTEATCPCSDQQRIEVRRGNASERKVDRVLDYHEHDPKHQGHDRPHHRTDGCQAVGSYPPDSSNQRSRSANVAAVIQYGWPSA